MSRVLKRQVSREEIDVPQYARGHSRRSGLSSSQHLPSSSSRALQNASAAGLSSSSHHHHRIGAVVPARRDPLSSASEHRSVKGNNRQQQRGSLRVGLLTLTTGAVLLAVGWMILSFRSMSEMGETNRLASSGSGRTAGASSSGQGQAEQVSEKSAVSPLPAGFDSVLKRARESRGECSTLAGDDRFDARSELPFHNDTVASLPSFGIIAALERYAQNPDATWHACQMPPATECDETHLTVVFMAHNPDRLDVAFNHIQKLLGIDVFQTIVREVVVVWNGERGVDESDTGRAMLEFAETRALRFVYPLKLGFPNDLFNRYHPDILGTLGTKAILYYDDDGPFYSFAAIQGGFELWKRHARQQVGAMAREISSSERQKQELRKKLAHLAARGKLSQTARHSDREFVSHCTNSLDDQVDYNYRYFANYDANMVLPSGSMLHRDYLCYLWHPALAELRKFVLLHPVRPDDMTVSMVVSQLAGAAPRVYSRRLNRQDGAVPAQSDRRRLTETRRELINNFKGQEEIRADGRGLVPPVSDVKSRHRRLMFQICWNCGAKMDDMKHFWADLRTEAINSLVRYFGSLNSGSIGWCEGSEHYRPKKEGRCQPIMARQGWLPWMNKDGTPKDTCP
jgi:hypothetical protein